MLSFILGVAAVAAIYGLLSLSLNIQAGMTGLLNFGVAAFFGIGAYATGIASMHGFPAIPAILVGMAIGAAAGVAVALLGRTLAAEYWAMATFALAELLRIFTLNAKEVTRGAQGIDTVDRLFPDLSTMGYDLAWLAIAGGLLAIATFLSWLVMRGQFGRVARMVREDESMVASLGHNVISAKVRVMVLSAPMAALAGSLFTHYSLYIGPEQMEPLGTYIVYTMIIVGGIGSLAGAVVGAFAVQALYASSRFIDDVIALSPSVIGGVRTLVIGVVLLAFLMWRPEGIVPERLRTINARR